MLSSWFKHIIIYGGLALLKNENNIDLMHCLNWSLTSKQLILSNSITTIRAHFSNTGWIFTLIFCLSYCTKVNLHNRNGAAIKCYKVAWEEIEIKNLTFLYRNLSLLLISLTILKHIDYLERLWCCLMCIAPYVMPRLPTLFSLCFVVTSMVFILSVPKWIAAYHQ